MLTGHATQVNLRNAEHHILYRWQTPEDAKFFVRFAGLRQFSVDGCVREQDASHLGTITPSSLESDLLASPLVGSARRVLKLFDQVWAEFQKLSHLPVLVPNVDETSPL
jgi:hypothetical protein